MTGVAPNSEVPQNLRIGGTQSRHRDRLSSSTLQSGKQRNRYVGPKQHLRDSGQARVLSEWQHGTELDEGVFRTAARIPLNGIQVDEAFVQRRRREVANPGE